MKIVLDLSILQAHSMSGLITQGYRAKQNCGHLDSEDEEAMAAWKRAYYSARREV